MESSLKNITIVGAGWLGEPLASVLQTAGHQVFTTTTSEEKAERLRSQGIQSSVLHVTPDSLQGDTSVLKQAEILVLTLPPGGRRDVNVKAHYPAKIEQLLAVSCAQKVLFTSSTSVYGEVSGWVDENSPLQASTASGQALIAVEQLLREQLGERLTTLRLAGLVGGDRHPGRWFAGKQQVTGGEQYVNLVRRQDVLGIIEVIIRQQAWGYTLNVCADEHPVKSEFYPYATRAYGGPPCSFEVDSRADPGKRVSNDRGKRLLNYTYQWADPMRFFQK